MRVEAYCIHVHVLNKIMNQDINQNYAYLKKILLFHHQIPKLAFQISQIAMELAAFIIIVSLSNPVFKLFHSM